MESDSPSKGVPEGSGFALFGMWMGSDMSPLLEKCLCMSDEESGQIERCCDQSQVHVLVRNFRRVQAIPGQKALLEENMGAIAAYSS